MKKLITSLFIALLFSGSVYSADTIYSIDQDNAGFGGGIDYIAIDKAASKYAPITGILNVNTDKYGEITKRLGSVAYNSTPTAGSQKHRRAYTYNQSDGDSYIVVQTSNSIVATIGDSTFNTVISTLSDVAECDFATAKDALYYVDGVAPGKWDGTTLTNFTVHNSTAYPTTCKYIANWYSRNWLAGDGTYKNRVYYTQAYAPGLTDGAYEDFTDSEGNLQIIDLGASDGDYITGMKVVKGRLYVFMRYKIFEIYQFNTGEFAYNLLSDNVGCLYNTTIDILDGMPIFLSHRGIEQFDGSQLTPRSLPIDYYMKDLRQLTFNQGKLSLDSSADWGAGSGTNIDTATYTGSVAIINTATDPARESYEGDGDSIDNKTLLNSATSASKWQSFSPLYDMVLSSAGFYMRTETNANANARIEILDASMNVLCSSTVAKPVPLASASNTWEFVDFSSNSITLAASSTYYFRITSINSPGWFYYVYSPAERYTRGHLEGETVVDMRFIVNGLAYKNDASYTSSIKQASGWGSWGQFSVTDSQQTGSAIIYYVKTSTAADNFASKPLITVVNGGAINSTDGPYIQIISSFSRTTSTAIPRVDYQAVTFYGSDNNVPTGKVWDDRYYLSANTSDSTSRNNETIVLQKNGEFTRYGIGAGCFAVYRDNLYYGDAQDTGLMLRMDVPNVFTDNGASYESYWTSKKISMHPLYKINMKELWVTTDGTEGTLDLSYNFDDHSGEWNEQTIYIGDTYGINVSKVNLTPSCYSRYFQLRIGNNDTEDFHIKRIDLLYDNVPSAE